MDPISAIGIASAVVTFVDISAKIVKRLRELNEVGSVPKAFREIKIRLPLILTIVTGIVEVEARLTPDAKNAFRLLISSCSAEVKRLESIIQRSTITANDTRLTKGRKAIRSVIEHSEVQKIGVALQHNLTLLTQLQLLPNSNEQTCRAADNRKSGTSLPTYDQIYGLFMLPFSRDAYFTGREVTLDKMNSALSEHGRVSVTGPGGVGKSQIAIEYAYRFREKNPDTDIFWVYGASPSRFYQAYKKIAQKLSIPQWDDPDVYTPELVVDFLNDTTRPFLLILDNADDIDLYWPRKNSDADTIYAQRTDLSRFIPDNPEHGQVLITSRDSRVANRLSRRGDPIVLPPMDTSEAKRLFLLQLYGEAKSNDDKAVIDIVETLDRLPLAITQAASFIKENGISAAEYLEALRNDNAQEFLDEELNDSRRDEASVNSIFRAWKLSFDQIKKQNPRATELLSLLAMLDRQSIPRWLLSMPGLVISIGVLKSFHMLTTRAESGSLQLHRLTQQFVQIFLKSSSQLEKYQEAAITLVSKAYPTEIGALQWNTCATLSPHVGVVIQYDCPYVSARLEKAHLLCWAADYDIERGLYHQAIRRAKSSLDTFRELTPSGDERLTAATWLYGRLRYYLADSDEELSKAAEILREAFRNAHPKTMNRAESAFELAHLYYDTGKEKECLEMGKASYQCWEEMEGASSARTLDARHDYALELAMFGHETEAISQWNEIIRLCPESDGTAKIKELYELRSAACIAEFKNDTRLAELLYSKLISLCSDIYNADHIHVFDYRLSHVEQVMRQGRLEEAIQESLDIMTSCQNKAEWRIMTTCYETLAECMRLKGCYAEEQPYRAKCVELPLEKLGEENIETVEATESLARCLLNIGEYEQAVPLLKKVLAWRERRQGSDHEDTIITTEVLAICKVFLREYRHAGELFRRAVMSSDAMGPDPRLQYNLCCTLWKQRQWPQLEGLCRTALQQDSKYQPHIQRMLGASLEGQNKTVEFLRFSTEHLHLQDVRADWVDDKSWPVQPPCHLQERRRFARMFHPRSWST